jgi:hypothetical protein
MPIVMSNRCQLNDFIELEQTAGEKLTLAERA